MRLPWTPLALLASGCAGWPLYADPPGADPEGVAAPEDPRSLLDPEWEAIAEGEDVDDPTAVAPRFLAPGKALLVVGSLAGVGWSDAATPRPVASEACGSEAPRGPFEQGDWIGDVDFVRVEVEADGQLCVEVATDRADVGWDLLLAEVDACGVPVAFVERDAEPLGFGLGGREGGWGVQVAAGSHAVLLAGYAPNDQEAEVAYRLGVSLLNPSPSGSVGPCPLLPEEAP